MNQSHRSRFTRTNLTREAREWLAKRTPRMVVTAPGNLCRVLVEGLKQFKKSNQLRNRLIAGTATTSKLSETPLRLSPSKCEELETRQEEGLQWVLTPIRQTAQAPSSDACEAMYREEPDSEKGHEMAFPQDFEWPTPEYIKCSDLAKCGYPHIYTVLERGLEALGWTYNINVGRWYPPPPKEKADGKDNLEGAKGASVQGLCVAGKGQGTRWEGSRGLPDRHS